MYYHQPKNTDISMLNSSLSELNSKLKSGEIKELKVSKKFTANAVWGYFYYGVINFSDVLPSGSKIINVGANSGAWFFGSAVVSGLDPMQVNIISPEPYTDREQNWVIYYI